MMCAVALEAFEQHAGQYGREQLRSRLALVGGDGAVCAGGEDARHASSGAAELIFEAVHEHHAPPMTDWDAFHRDDLAVSRAIKSTPAAKHLYDVVAALNSCFGMSEGRTILRAVGATLDEHVQEQHRFGGTRKVGHMNEVPKNLIRNFKAIGVAIHTRMQWRRSGHGTWSLDSLTQLARCINDPSFVVFLILFGDLTAGPLREHAHLVQKSSEPWLVRKQDERLLEHITALKTSFQRLETLVSVSTLCSQHLAPQEAGRFFVALSAEKPLARLPNICRFLPRLMFRSPPMFREAAGFVGSD
eukprot:s4012_g8.t1